MSTIKTLLLTLLLSTSFTSNLNADVTLSANQATTTISFQALSLDKLIGCIYVDDEYFDKLTPDNIRQGETTIETTTLIERLKGRTEFDIAIFTEGIAAGDTVRQTTASRFVQNSSQAEDIFSFSKEIPAPKTLQNFVFRRFSELREIRANIIATDARWTAGLNPIFMLLDSERENLLGLRIPDDIPQQKAKIPKPDKPPPSSLDWRNRGGYNWMTKVKNQGGCGSCWAFAAVGQVEALVNVAENDPTIDLNLAEQTPVTDCCSWCGSCNGGWHDNALEYIRDTGIPLESCDPYTASNGPCDQCTDWLSQARKITSYSQVTGGWYDEDDIKNTLVYHPVSTTVYVDNSFLSYNGGIFSYTGSVHSLNHAIVFVGWDDAENYWIIKNSWGSGWGESGYMRAIRGQNNHLGWYTYDAEYTPLAIDAGDDIIIPLGDTVTLNPTISGGAPNYAEIPPDNYTYLWEPSLGLSDPTAKNPQAYPPITTTYTLTASDLNTSKIDGLTVTVISDRYVIYLKHAIDDDSTGVSAGNGDGIADAGETIEMPLWVKNWGIYPAYDVTGILITVDPYVTITDSSEAFGTIPPGDSATTSSFVFQVDPAIPDSHYITFTLSCTDSADSSWTWDFEILARHFSSITGQVIDAVTSLGITGATVTCRGAKTLIDTTNENGNYEFADLAGRTYTLVASAAGFFDSDSVLATIPPDTVLDFVLVVPIIEITPDLLQVNLLPEDTTSQLITIKNTGTDTLTFSISESGVVPTKSVQSLNKNQNYHEEEFVPTTMIQRQDNVPHQGLPVPLGSGGPDAAGYCWLDSDQPGGPIYNWIDITGIGIPLTSWTSTASIDGDDEGYTGPLELGFNFEFYGIPYSSIYVGANGYIGFSEADMGTQTWTNYPIPATNTPNGFIAGLWSDMDGGLGEGGNGTAYFYTDDTKAIIEYKDWSHYSPDNLETFEIILYPDGEIIFQYQSTSQPAGPYPYTIGIENQSGNIGLEVAFNTPYVHDNLAISISKNVEWLSEDPVSGKVPPGDSTLIQISYNALGLVLDTTYKAWLKIASNDPKKALTTLPVTLTTYAPGDVGVVAITSLPETVYVDSTYTPQADVTNFGGDPVQTFQVTCRIDTSGTKSYLNTQSVFSLASSDTTQVTFDAWVVPYVAKHYTVTVFTQFPNDINNANDTISITVHEHAVEEPVELPKVFALSQNTPNPFTRTTNIMYQLPVKSYVILKVYDITGRLVTTLLNTTKEPGYFTITWNAQNMPAGIYFLKFSAGDFTKTKKLILMR